MILYQNIPFSSNYENAYFRLMFSLTNNSPRCWKIWSEIQKVILYNIINMTKDTLTICKYNSRYVHFMCVKCQFMLRKSDKILF